MKPLEKLFWEELAEMVHVEEMLSKAFPKMREAAEAAAIKTAFETNRLSSQQQVEMVRSIFAAHELPAREKKCEAMMGMLLRGQQFMLRSGPASALDAALLSVARKISNYKLGSYATMAAWAVAMEAPKVSKNLLKALKLETEASQRVELLVAQANSSAAKQATEAARKPNPKPRTPDGASARRRETEPFSV